MTFKDMTERLASIRSGASHIPGIASLVEVMRAVVIHLGEFRDRLDSQCGRLASLERWYDKCQSMKTTRNERLEALERRLAHAESRLDAMDKRLLQLEQKPLSTVVIDERPRDLHAEYAAVLGIPRFNRYQERFLAAQERVKALLRTPGTRVRYIATWDPCVKWSGTVVATPENARQPKCLDKGPFIWVLRDGHSTVRGVYAENLTRLS
jgi:hypothetical protein